MPNVLYEPPTRRRLGPADRFPDGHTYLPDDKIFVIRKEGRIRAVSAICPHLGCTVGTKAEGYHCPCHGSKFDPQGNVLSGPAPRAEPSSVDTELQDIVYILDGHLPDPRTFTFEKDAIKQSIAALPADGSAAVAVINFGEVAVVEQPLIVLDSPSTVQSVLDVIDTCEQIGGL